MLPLVSYQKLFLTLLLSIVVLSLGCGSGEKNQEETFFIGKTGGTYSSSDGKVSIVVPANALLSDTLFSADKLTSYPQDVIPNTVYHITPDNLSFLTTVELKIKYEDGDIPPAVIEAEMWLAKLIDGRWVEVADYSIDTAVNQITGKLNGLSTYAIAYTTGSTNIGVDIGENGGSVVSQDDIVTIDIPQGALNKIRAITIMPVSSYPTGILENSGYNFGPDGLLFSTPVTVTLKYDEAALPQGVNEADLWLGEMSEGRWFRVPGSSVNSQNNIVTGQLKSFSIYGIGYGNDLVEVDKEAYVVDTPQVGSSNQFDNIFSGISYLNNTLAEDETGKLILQTDRDLSVTTLDLQRAIIIVIADGYSAKIVGPGVSPVIITGAGSIGLNGLSISNAGGLQVNTFGNLDLNNNSLPATTITLGGTISSKPLLHRKLSSRQQGVYGDRWGIGNNKILGPFIFSAATGFKGEFDLHDNTAPIIKFDGYAMASTVINASKNVADDIFFKLTMGQQAFLKVSNHQNLNSLNMDLNLLEQTRVENIFNTVANLELNFDGDGFFNVFGKANNVGTAYIGIGTGSEAEYTIEDSNYDDVKTVINRGEISWVNNGLVVRNKLELESKDQTILNLHMGAGVDIDGLLQFILKGDFKYTIADDVRMGGFATILASGNLSDIRGGGVRVETGLTIDVHGVTGSVFTSFVEGDEFRGVLDYVEPNSAQQMFSVNKADFRIGGAISINHDLLSGQKPQLSSAIQKVNSRVLAAEGIVIKDIIFEGPVQGAPGVGIGNIDEDITIENCTFSGSNNFAINIGVTNGTVNINKNTLNDAGINLTDVHGSLSITENIITQAPNGIATTLTSEVSVSKNDITANNVLFASFDSIINADSNKLNGNVIIGGGEAFPSRMYLTNNQFGAGSGITDATGRAGGLYNDPIGDSGNTGLNPGLINSLIDWNEPHPCADYPPERNTFVDPEQTECHTEGIGPP